MQGIGYARYLRNGLVELPYVACKRLNLSHEHTAVYHEVAAQHAGYHETYIAHQLIGRHHNARIELRLPRRFLQFAVVSGKLLFGAFFTRKQLDDVLSAEYLLYLSVHVSQIFLRPEVIFLRLLHDNQHYQHGYGDYHQRHQRQNPVYAEHHYHNADKRGRRSKQLGKRLVERSGYHIHVVGEITHHLAVRGAVEVFERQFVYLRIYILAEAVGNALRHGGEDKALRVGQRARNAYENKRFDKRHYYGFHVYARFALQKRSVVHRVRVVGRKRIEHRRHAQPCHIFAQRGCRVGIDHLPYRDRAELRHILFIYPDIFLRYILRVGGKPLDQSRIGR